MKDIKMTAMEKVVMCIMFAASGAMAGWFIFSMHTRPPNIHEKNEERLKVIESKIDRLLEKP